MRSKKWVAVLVLAAVAVAVENYLFFTAGPSYDTSGDYAEEDAEEDEAESDDYLARLAPVSSQQVAAYVVGLPNPEQARNPFMTRAELDALAQDDTTGTALPSLDGTLTGPNRRVAWLDGTPASEGDVLGGFKILRITERSVFVRGPDQELRLDVANEREAPPAAPDLGFDDELRNTPHADRPEDEQ